ncbi:hypothetical protein D5085_09470 [Ectothiorhodospiraceae bacterium BW-2]|nr:hypothetical protein D5085_09470 [Ectothiorhodospiraceae bacterium BW-2]
MEDTPITISTIPAIDSISPNPVTLSLGASATTVTLTQTEPISPVNINLSDSHSIAESPSYDPHITFVDALLKFDNIATQTGGKPSSEPPHAQTPLYLRAVETDETTGACVAAISSESRSVNVGYSCIDPASCAAGAELELVNLADFASGTPTTVAAAGGPITLTFDANGYAPFSFQYNNVGQIRLHTDPLSLNGATLTGANSNPFVVKPDALSLANSSSSATPFKAGVGGEVTLTALLADGTTPASQFGKESSPASLALTYSRDETAYPYPGQATIEGETLPTTLSRTSADYQQGATSLTTIWSEAGQFTLSATLSDYLGSGSIGPVTDELYFAPFSYTITKVDGSADEGIIDNSQLSFTYVGESVTFLAPPTFRVTAINHGGATTQNVASTWSSSFNPATIAATSASGTESNGTSWQLTNPSSSATDFVDGVATVTLDGQITHTKTATPVPPFTAAIAPRFTISLTDTIFNELHTQALTFNPVGNHLRYGRATLADSYGNETDTQSILFNVEYVDSDGNWIINPDDSGTLLSAASDLTCTIPSPLSCATDGSSADISVSGTLLTPGNSFTLTPDSSGVTGRVTLRLLNPSWLRFDWNGDGDLDDSDDYDAASATFGIYRGDDRIYYRMEAY